MKRILVFLLAVCAVLTMVPFSFSAIAEGEDDANENIVLPASFTLVGTKHLPPVSNQGSIGTCASSSITYLQFSNAVSRYLHSINPDIEWDPSSGKAEYIFSPKFTYNFAGSGTEWVYRILMENGCMTWDESQFKTTADGAYTDAAVGAGGNRPTETTSWDVNAGDMFSALNYRLTNYEQIWLRRQDGPYSVDGKVQITNNENGQALIKKIKEALVEGNVVVTGGLTSLWVYQQNAVVRDTQIAKKGESVLYCGRGTPAGGHQVCVVGYDDNIVAKVKGVGGKTVEMRGAFLIQNSWGDGWENDGRIWLMYDALNDVSEYPELNFSDRYYPMDQFCFTYWDKDITNELPELSVEVTVMANDRTGIKIEPSSRNIGASKAYRSYVPKLFEYAGHHGDYGDSRQFGFDGNVAGKKNAVGVFTFPLEGTYLKGRAGNLQFGVKVTALNGVDVTVMKVTVRNGNGEVISETAVPNGEGLVKSGKSLEFYADGVKLVSGNDLPKVDGAEIALTTKDAYVKEGSKLSFTVTPDADNAGKVAVVTLDGKEIAADNGVFTVELYRDSDLKVELIDKPEEPVVEPGENDTTTDDKKEDGSSNTTIIIIAVVAAVVVIGAAVAVVLAKKKKK